VNSESKFRTGVAVQLARRSMAQRDLARLLNIPDTTLSDWLRSVHPAPADLSQRIERALGLKPGELGH
jgi:DNA-binding transcriptional regulator YdaS (Cro superfamily)